MKPQPADPPMAASRWKQLLNQAKADLRVGLCPSQPVASIPDKDDVFMICLWAENTTGSVPLVAYAESTGAAPAPDP